MEKIVEKYWKWVLLATIIIFILIPLNILVNKDAILQLKDEYIQQAGVDNYESANSFAEAYVETTMKSMLFSTFNILVLLVYPVLLSAKLIKNAKSDNLTREDIVGQIVFVAIPYLINGIILIAIKFTGGISEYFNLGEIAKWIGVSIVVGVFISQIANFVGCFAKKQATHIISVYSFLFLPMFIILGFQKLLQILIYGYIGFSNITNSIITEWPSLKVFSLFSYNYAEDGYMCNFGIGHVLVYIALIALLIYATYKIINKHKTYIIIPILTIYGFIFLTTVIAIGVSAQLINIVVATLISLAISGVIYALCVLPLKEKNIKKLAISYGIYSIIMFSFVMVAQNNIFGFETNIPELEDVEYAVFTTANPINTTPTIIYKEKDNIQYIINRQRDLVNNKSIIKEEGIKYYKYYIQYRLKDGGQITRVYEIPSKYEDIYDSLEFINQRYAYILDNELNANLTNLNIIGVYDDRTFEIEVSKDESLYNELINDIEKDITSNKAYKYSDDTYGIHGKTEGLRYLTVDISINNAVSEDYFTYGTTNDFYELVKDIQKMIDEENQKIVWEK